jgi:hypothetical protein
MKPDDKLILDYALKSILTTIINITAYNRLQGNEDENLMDIVNLYLLDAHGRLWRYKESLK